MHIESPRPVLLFAESEAIAERAAIGVVRSKPQEICPSPCDRVVDGRPGVRFFVTGAPGDDMPRSSSFILGDRESPVQVDVKPGNLRIRDAGISVALVGVAFALGGLVTVGVAGANKDATEATKHREIVTAITLDAVAVIHIAVGVPLGLVGETRIDVHDLARKKVSVPRKPRYWAGEF